MPEPEADSLKRLLRQLQELLEYTSYYLDARIDGIKLSLNKAAWRAELELVGILATAGLIVVGGALVFVGVAGGLGELFGGRVWLGKLTAGLLLLSCTVAVIWIRAALTQKISHDKTVEKYELRKQQQRAKFGHDVADQAATSPKK